MIKKKEGGQAFILVLILLAIGALVVIPALRLTTTVLKSNQIITQRNVGLYACEAAQERIMWMLYNDIDGIVSENLTADGDTISFTVDVCGTTVYAGIVMRAVEMEGGVVLSGEHTIMSTKTVEPSWVELPGEPGRIFTYTIAFDQVSVNNTAPLLAVYDILPIDFGKNFSQVYVPNSSAISDDGEDWDTISDPSYGTAGLQMRLEWLSFPSGFGYFEPGQVKYLRFKVNDTLTDDDNVNCNWVVLQVGDIFTVSTPQAPITVGHPDPSEGCDTVGVFSVTKSSDPAIIPPLQPTEVTYTITITNVDEFTRHIEQIDDYLPPGFEYTDNTTSGVTALDPYYEEFENVNDVERWHLIWDGTQLSPDSIAAGANVTLSFTALAAQGISGTYYNEVLVQPQSLSDIKIFTDIDASLSIWDLLGSMYSWNSGIVIVPAYDSSTGAEGENITASMALEPDHIRIISWNVE